MSWDADRHYLREGLPNTLPDCQVLGSHGPIISPSVSPTKMWQQLLLGRTQMRFLQGQLKTNRSPAADDPELPVPLTQECIECICLWFQEERWVSRVPFQVPLPSLLLYTDALLTNWGCTSSRSDGVRDLVLGAEGAAHEHVAIEGDDSGIERLP